MTKKLDGALFEEPVVIIGCPDPYNGGCTAEHFAELYKGIPAEGRWEGVHEHCVCIPLAAFTAIITGKHVTNGHGLLKHLSTEKCIAIFYRLTRNPRNLMCAIRKAPRLFGCVWEFIPNEDVDNYVHVQHDMGQDGLLINGMCLHSNARVQ